MFIILLVLCCIYQKNECLERVQLGRVLLVINGFFLILLWILVFLLLVGSAIVSGSCGLVEKLNKNEVSVLYEFDELNEDVRKIAELCIFKNSTGNIQDVLSDDDNANVVSSL